MKSLATILIFLISLKSFGLTLSAQSEAFILKSSGHDLILLLLNGEHKNKIVSFVYNPQNPKGKLFSANPIDQLAAPETNVKKAINIFFPFETTVEELQIDLTPEMKKRMKENLFTSLDNYVPISNLNVPDMANDRNLNCPERPKRKNGQYCPHSPAFKIHGLLKEVLLEEAQKEGEDPALVASIIHHESLFDSFIENLHEKKKCLRDEKNCSPYRWGAGLAQLGKTDAPLYGLDWDKSIRKPRACRKKNLLNEKCFRALMKKCKRYQDDKLQPLQCPRAAIRATVLKIKAMIPTSYKVQVVQNEEIIELDVAKALRQNKAEEIRNKIGLYNRSIKVVNSYVQYFDRYGEFPKFYGEAWSIPRTSQAPSRSMGFQMLTKEYINRCYVWELAGLCGEIPKKALYSQYQAVFQ